MAWSVWKRCWCYRIRLVSYRLPEEENCRMMWPRYLGAEGFPGLAEARNSGGGKARYDGHQRIEVIHVKTFFSHLNPLFEHRLAEFKVFLFHEQSRNKLSHLNGSSKTGSRLEELSIHQSIRTCLIEAFYHCTNVRCLLFLAWLVPALVEKLFSLYSLK